MEGGATKERLEANKRAVLINAIEDILPELVAASSNIGRRFAASTLEEIQQGNNPDLEPSLRRAVEELGINLS
jgi:hypothetical protein